MLPFPSYTIMKSPELNRQLITDGYITLPLLSESQIENFKQLYRKWHPINPDAFFKSYFSSNRDYKIEVEKEIIKAFRSTLVEHFHDFQAFGAMFVVKPKGERGQIPPHQDWSFVDETKNWSLNAWCPLIDTTGDNGNIQMLPGSHMFMETIRGSGTPEYYNQLYDVIQKDVVDVPLKAGECVFFYHGILHCSTFNYKNYARVVLGLSMVQNNAPLYYHFLKEGESEADKYQINNTNFYLDYVDHRGEEPENMDYLGKAPQEFESVSMPSYEQFKEQYASLRQVQKLN